MRRPKRDAAERLLEMADEVQEKKLTTAKAIAEAKKLIETNTRKL